jgi:hypothetical protein
MGSSCTSIFFADRLSIMQHFLLESGEQLMCISSYRSINVSMCCPDFYRVM